MTVAVKIARYPKYAPMLVGAGFDTTPLDGKKPILQGWQGRPDTALDFENFNGANIGVLCGGRSNVVAVDVDIYDEAIAEQICNLIEDDLGFAPQRIGQAPKTLFVFRCTEPMRKIKTAIFDINGTDNAVELLAEGQQFVASGIHPDTKKKYRWSDDSLMDVTVEQLTEVTPQQLHDFIAVANTTLSQYGEKKGRESNGAAQLDWFATNELQGEVREVDVALAHIDNDDWHYDDWVRMAMSIKGAVGDEGYELWHRWSKRSDKYDDQETDRVWYSIKDVKRVGAGSIFYMAKENGFDIGEFRREEKKDPVVVDQKTGLPAGMYRASEVTGPVPEREWLLDQWFPKKAVGLLFGQGGVGKTLLVQQLANCIADGEPFMGIQTRKMPVLCVLCEDDKDEIDRRQISINEWRGIEDGFGSAPDDLYLWPRVGEDNIVVTFPNAGEDQATQFYEDLTKAVETARGEADEICVILDNATDFFGGNENARREVNTFIKSYCGNLCTTYNATVILLAHPSLSGLASGSGMSGSTAWENSVRSRSYLSREQYNDDVRVLSRKKSNYSETGDESNVMLIWESGVLQVPTSQSAVDRIEQRALKLNIAEAVDRAWKDKTPFRSKNSSGRKVTTALPREIKGHRKGVVLRAFMELCDDGFITHVERKGYEVVEMPKWGSTH